MDILNFISWIKGKRVVTTVDPNQTLLPVGLKDNRRDDGYLAGAISVVDFITQLGPGQVGPQGPQGIQGIQGSQGIQGISGTSGLETWVRYSPTFQATGMTFTGSGITYPTYNSYYVKSGLLVSFVIEIDFTTVTNFGTGQYKVALPFAPGVGYNHFNGWVWADPNIDPDTGTGHTILNADTAGITTVLDLHYLKQSGGANSPIREGLWIQGTPVVLTTISKAYVNGTYIALV